MRLTLSALQGTFLPALAAFTLAVASVSSAQDEVPNAGRIGYISGNVSIEPSGTDSFGQAFPNLPIGPGDRIVTDGSGRVELQVGQTYVRVGPNSDVSLVEENPGNIVFGLGQGNVRIHVFGLWPQQAVRVMTPNGVLSSLQRTEMRAETLPDQSASIFTAYNTEVIASGAAGFYQHIEGGQSLELSGANPPYPQWLGPPPPDDLDNWSLQRDGQLANLVSFRYMSPYIPGAVELDAAGDWTPGTPYGAVWFPRGLQPGWTPYHYGHWVSRAPWGWTWVEDEPWGYAPFHYGRWIAINGRWGWVPGPPTARPIYSPALVVFAGGIQAGGVGLSVWFPLGPGEPYRPWYPCPPHYVDEVNISNITETNIVHVQKTYVNIVNVTNVTNITYVNRTTAVTAVNQNDFASGRPAAQAAVKVAPQQLEHVNVVAQIAVKPTPAAIVGHPPAHPVAVAAARPTLMNTNGKLVAAKPGAREVEPPVKAVSAPKPIPGRAAVAPPPNAKTPPPAAGAKPEARPAPAPPPPAKSANPPVKAPEARPAPAPAEKPEAKPSAPAKAPEAKPETAPKPEDNQGKPAAKPTDKNKKQPEKKPEDKKPEGEKKPE